MNLTTPTKMILHVRKAMNVCFCNACVRRAPISIVLIKGRIYFIVSSCCTHTKRLLMKCWDASQLTIFQPSPLLHFLIDDVLT